MAYVGIISAASMQRACSSQHISKNVSTQSRPARSLQSTNLVTPNVEPLKLPKIQESAAQEEIRITNEDHSHPRFCDERWKNGSWDLNMFVKQGRMDWDSVIVAEAKRRKFVEVHPEASRNDEPVVFLSSVIPWWAWIVHSHLPEAERLNGRAAMLGFFMGYAVDGMTGLGIVGQSGNFICKAALLLTVVGVVLFRRKEDLHNIKKLADEATFYDKQWQASWKTPEKHTTTTTSSSSR